jgi:carboxyl-terminal processing protease
MSEFSKKMRVFLPLLCSVVLAVGIYVGYRLGNQPGAKQTYILNTNRPGTLQEILGLTGLKYVDSVNLHLLKTEAIQGILSHLDPHSVYIPSAELASVNEDLEGSFQGIGVEFLVIDDTINITGVIAGGPSSKAGVETGDKLIRVGDSTVAGVHITTRTIKSLLRGPSDSRIQLTFLRGNEPVSLQVRRGTIPIESIDAAYMIQPGIGYIRINRFAANTYGEFMEAMLALQKDSLRQLIIDLRQNAGGYLDAAVNIADELLSDQKLIVYTEGQHYPRMDYTCHKAGVFEKGGLAILVDGGSASASEILSGAVQDWDRGTIIGRRTFGKGLVQEQYKLSDGGALRLTVARYYIPSGRSIQRSYKQGAEAYYDDILQRYAHGELTHADSIHFADTTRYYTRLKHRRVFGGGGIMPDVFVPIDTVRLDSVVGALYRNNTLFEFAYEYYSRHKAEFAGFSDLPDYVKSYTPSPAVLEAFDQFAQKRGLGQESLWSPEDRKEVNLRIKAFIARAIWQLKGYYEVMNIQDRAVHKAVDVLSPKPSLDN